MRDHRHARAAIAHARKLPGHGLHVGEIEPARGLVQHQNAGPLQHAGRNGQSLALAARERQRMPIGQMRQAETVERLAGRRPRHLAAAEAAGRGRFQLACGRMSEQLVARLLHHQERPASPSAIWHRSAPERHLSRALAMQPGQAARKCRLPRAVVSHQSRDTPGREHAGGPAQHIAAATIARTKVAERERCSGGGVRSEQGSGGVLPGRRRVFGAGILDAPGPQAHPVKLARGQALEFRSRPVVGDAPVLHMHHPIGYPPQPPQPMLGDDHRAPQFFQTPNEAREGAHGNHIECGRGLVESEHLRAQRMHRRKGHHLALTSRKLPDVTVEQMGDAQVGRGAANAKVDLIVRQARVLAPEGDLGGGVQVEELAARILEHGAHVQREPLDAQVGCILPQHAHRTGKLTVVGLGRQPVHEAHERGLPATGTTRHRHALPSRDGQVHTLQHRLEQVSFRIGIGERHSMEFHGHAIAQPLRRRHASTPAPSATDTPASATKYASSSASAAPMRSS